MPRKSAKPDRPPILVPEGFQETWNDWIEYKWEEKRQYYKTEKSESIGFKNLYNLSFQNPEIARKIVDQSIGNLWDGLHPLKQYTNGVNPNTGRTKTNSESWLDLALRAAKTGTF